MQEPRNTRLIWRRIQLLAVLGCLTWGGYQVTSNALAQTDTTEEPAIVNTTDQDIERLYSQLPPEVARVIPSVVATLQVNDNQKQGTVASGVIINGEQILTAGHNVEGDSGLACRQTTVIAPGLLTSAAASSDVVTHASVSYGKSSDLALLTLRSGDNFKALPDIKLSQRPPEKGDRVYFINFQPTADGTVRSPASPVTADPSKDYSKPAVFSGRVLGRSNHGVAIATGGGVSLGIGAPDVLARKGASGGAIVNERGELVGLSVSSESLLADRSAASIAKEYQLVLEDAGKRYQVAYMQPVDGGLVKHLQASMISCASSTAQ